MGYIDPILARAAVDLLTLNPQVITGTTDIDDSAQTETSWFPILTIAPASGAPLADVVVAIDLAKATTGFAAVESLCRANRSIHWHIMFSRLF